MSGVESHNSIGDGERYHDPLRRIYQKIRFSEPGLELELVMRLAVKAMNDTMNPEGLVPSLLVFGVLPRFPPMSSELPRQQEIMRALEVARAEMETISNELRLRTALLSRLPNAATFDLEVGQAVFVYREGHQPYKWTGPYKVTKIEDRQVFIDRDGQEVQHSRSQVKPYLVDPPDEIVEALFTSVRSMSSRKYELTNVNLTETLHPRDPRGNMPMFTEANRKEIKGLLEKGTWKVVLKREVPADAKMLSGRFVLTVKNANTDEEVYKARYVVQVHRDKEKKFLVHDSTNLRQRSNRLLVAIAAIFSFRIWSHDVRKAFLQSAEKLTRKVFLKPSKEFELSEGQLLELLKPLYGLSDSREYWNRTMTNHLKRDLDMKPLDGDLSLFVKHVDSKLVGLTGTYVDDSLWGGNEDFMAFSDKSLKKFESREKEVDNTTFAGVRVKTTNDEFELTQEHYTKKLKILLLDCSFSDFRSLRHQLAWLTHTRPEIYCSVNMAAQVTEQKFTTDHIKAINKVVKHVKGHPSIVLKCSKLDVDSLRLKVYADSSFANNDDLSSQLGFIVLLVDKHDRCNILQF